MALHLAVTRCGGLPPEQPLSLSLDAGSCTLGRNPENDLVLSDPERMVSSYHARIELRDQEFWLTDQSTNGTFINQSRERLTQNQPVALHDGDTLVAGPYEIAVSIDSDAPQISFDPFLSVEPALPGMETPGGAPDIMDLLGGGGQSAQVGRKPVEDPFADARPLDPFLTGPAPMDQEPRAAEPHRTPVEHVHFRPPETSPIPEEYDLLADELMSPAPAQQVGREPPSGAGTGPEPEPAREGATPDADLDWHLDLEPSEPPAYQDAGLSCIGAQPPGPPAEPAEQPKARPVVERPPTQSSAPSEPNLPRSGGGALAALLAGLGTGDPDQVKNPDALLHDAGALLRTLTAGLTTTMMVRAQFKSELRLGVTTIRRAENNPFKFSVSPEEALDRLLLHPNPAFLPALEAAQSAFEDIQAHEMAMIAGLRAALRALLARFEPDALEARLGSVSGLDRLLPMARKSRYWELFTETYGQVAADAEEDFMQLFGEAFARAYEDQIHRLAQARRANRETGPG